MYPIGYRCRYMPNIPLTARQQTVLDLIESVISEQGYPPTVREIASRLRLAGPKGAKQHLDALVAKGFIRRAPGRPRALEIVGPGGSHRARAVPILKSRPGQPAPSGLGRSPTLPKEQVEGHLTLDHTLVPRKEAFLLRVYGEGMAGAGVYDGDLALVQPGSPAQDGEIVVANVNGALVIRRFYRRGTAITLVPANSRMMDAVISQEAGEQLEVIGKVVGLLRMFRLVGRAGQAADQRSRRP